MTESPDSVLNWLQEFYLSECDGQWEHGVGYTISTLDNPGWSIDFDLEATPLENKAFEPIRLERTENDWVHCRVEANLFQGRGGPKNLTELLTIFRDWASAS
jgi:Immunity protein 53